MALVTYADLVKAVVDWPDLQGEPDLEAVVPTLIALAEAAINNDSNLRLSGALTQSLIADGDSAVLPADCLQVSRVSDANGLSVEPVSRDALTSLGGCSGRAANRFAIDGKALLFDPPAVAYWLSYYQRPPALETAGTHWLFEQEPGLYLWGSLMQAAVFSKESEAEAQRYQGMYAACIERLASADWTERMPTGQAIKSHI